MLSGCDIRAMLMILAALVTACAPLNHGESPFSGLYENYSTCRAEYAAMDDRIDAAGVRNAEFWRVPGYPYLRTDRLLATFGSKVQDVNELGEWIGRMRALDQDSREFEFRNLGMSDLELVTQRDRFLNCGRILADIELTEPEALKRLAKVVLPDDEYSDIARVIGLHGWRAADIRKQQRAQKEKIVKASSGPLSRPSNMELWGAPLVEDIEILDLAREKPELNVLGYPMLFGSQWRALVESNAPLLWIESEGERDRPASLHWVRDGIRADATRPGISYQAGYTRVGEKIQIQLTYTAWFSSVAGEQYRPVDGLIWRVTLDDQFLPIVYESLHPSGADHRWYPVRRMVMREDDASDVGYVAADIAPLNRPVLRLESGTHQILRVVSLEDIDGSDIKELALTPYEDLYTLALPSGGTRSAFGPNGFLVGSQGNREMAGWSSGIPRPGALRQAGHHAIAIIGRQHFDDPDLLDRTFESLGGAVDRSPLQEADVGGSAIAFVEAGP